MIRGVKARAIRAAIAFLAFESPDEFLGPNFVCSAKSNEFRNIDTPLTRFAFGNKGLGLPQPFGGLSLSQPGVDSRLAQ